MHSLPTDILKPRNVCLHHLYKALNLKSIITAKILKDTKHIGEYDVINTPGKKGKGKKREKEDKETTMNSTTSNSPCAARMSLGKSEDIHLHLPLSTQESNAYPERCVC